MTPILTTFDSNSLTILSGFVKDKIVGRARVELQKHGRVNDWNLIKLILTRAFGEKVSVNHLLDQIRSARIKTNIEDYYNHINNLLSRINNSLLLQNQNDPTLIQSNKRIHLHCEDVF